jgi:hypothetical protein
MAEHTFALFAHTNHEHASTSTLIVAKLPALLHFFPSLAGKQSPLAPMFSDNMRRGGA